MWTEYRIVVSKVEGKSSENDPHAINVSLYRLLCVFYHGWFTDNVFLMPLRMASFPHRAMYKSISPQMSLIWEYLSMNNWSQDISDCWQVENILLVLVSVLVLLLVLLVLVLVILLLSILLWLLLCLLYNIIVVTINNSMILIMNIFWYYY